MKMLAVRGKLILFLIKKLILVKVIKFFHRYLQTLSKGTQAIVRKTYQ